jgi:hypothetical protein
VIATVHREMKNKIAPKKTSRRPSIVEPLLISIADPKGTANRLIKPNDYPPYGITLILIFLCVCVSPPLVYAPIYYEGGVDTKKTATVLTSTIMTISLLVILLSFIAHACNVKRPFGKIFASVAYCTAPLTIIFATLLLANKILMGNLTLLTFISNNLSLLTDLISHIFPFALRIALAVSLFNLSQFLSAASRGGLGLGIVLALLTVPLLLGSFVASLWIIESFDRSASYDVITFFSNFMAYPAK